MTVVESSGGGGGGGGRGCPADYGVAALSGRPIVCMQKTVNSLSRGNWWRTAEGWRRTVSRDLWVLRVSQAAQNQWIACI